VNPKNLLATLSKAQSQMASVQKEAEAAVFEGSAQNGLVKVSIKGTGEPTRVELSPVAMGEDAETLEALILVAFSDAYRKKEEFSKARLAKVAGSLLPMGLKIPGMT